MAIINNNEQLKMLMNRFIIKGQGKGLLMGGAKRCGHCRNGVEEHNNETV